MSHNLYTLNTTGANVFSYHGANLGFIKIGSGESVTYNSTLSWATDFEWYDTNRINTISGASFTESGGWISEIHLPAGDYDQGNNATWLGNIDQGSGYAYSNDLQFITRIGSQYVSATDKRLDCLQISKIVSYSVATSLKFVFYTTASSTTAISDPNNRVSESQFLFIRRLA
jgi:hypothetical protein